MVRQDGREHAPVSRILQPKQSTKNRLALYKKRLSQNFYHITGSDLLPRRCRSEAKLLKMALARRYDALSRTPDLDIKAAIAYRADHRTYRGDEHFALFTSGGRPL
jgi:hypothetical protein